MGDGVLVYFGYPQAHEDDSERAVRAGLACVDVVSRLDVVNALDFCHSRSAEALLVEWGGDVLGANVPAFLTCLMARRTDLKVILVAADALGAMDAQQILAERGLAISLTTGPCTDTPTMRERTQALCGVSAVSYARGHDQGKQSHLSAVVALGSPLSN
jgi:hypothetical protein